MRTWQKEAVVASVFLSVSPIIHRSGWEALGALAVLLSFMHGQIGDRHSAAASRQYSTGGVVEVECWRWERRYFLGKEVLWVVYFVHLQAWSALVGCALFLVYPLWRKWWVSRRPTTG